MSRNGYSRGRGGAALLLLIAAVALVVAVLAIFTSVFEEAKAKPDDAPGTDVIQPAEPDDTGSDTPDVPADPDNGNTLPDDTSTPDTVTKPDGSRLDDPTRPASGTITTSEKPYQSGGVYVVGNTGYEMYNYVGSLAEKYQQIVNGVADDLSGTATVYVMAIPLSSGITLPDSLYRDIPGSDQAQAEKDILAGMGNNVKTVALHDTLMAHRNEYIYFRTDHHWTALGAYYAYAQFCAAKGITPHELSEYEISQYPGFLGSFYNDSGKPDAMAATPDTVNAYHPLSADAHMEYGSGENSSLTGGKVIFDESTAAASLKYGTFIMGDNPYTVIENPDLTDGSACIVVKESFGNAFVPFLVDHYQTVYVVDYRYYGGSVTALARSKNVSDVLFVNNLSAIRGSYQIGKLNGVK